MHLPSLTPKRKLVLAGFLALVMFALALVVGISLQILRTQNTSSFARTFVRVIPVPAARANGRFVWYRDVIVRWDAADQALATAPPPAPTDDYVLPSRETSHRRAYEQAIRDAYFYAQAEKEDFTVPDAAVQMNIDRLVVQASSTRQEIEQYLQHTMGWSLQEYGERVVRPATLEEALFQRAVAANASTTADLWRAQTALALQGDKVVRYLHLTAPL